MGEGRETGEGGRGATSGRKRRNPFKKMSNHVLKNSLPQKGPRAIPGLWDAGQQGPGPRASLPPRSPTGKFCDIRVNNHLGK